MKLYHVIVYLFLYGMHKIYANIYFVICSSFCTAYWFLMLATSVLLDKKDPNEDGYQNQEDHV